MHDGYFKSAHILTTIYSIALLEPKSLIFESQYDIFLIITIIANQFMNLSYLS